MHVLISTIPMDAHAAAVALYLRDRGHKVSLLFGQRFPAKMMASLHVSDELPPFIEATEFGRTLDLRNVDCVWNRRHDRPAMPSNLDPVDRDFALLECRQFWKGMWQLSGANAFWVNRELASSEVIKPAQLAIARDVGLRIPKTLMSNDPRQIRDFVHECRGGAIYKPFQGAKWEVEGKVSLLYTSALEATDLDSDQELQLAPGIFQERVPKSYEIRATFMGATCFAVAIDSQSTELSRIDSRGGEPKRSRIELPARIVDACCELMRRLGIVFGCFDLIVTPSGDMVFLEVNEMGQFLYLGEEVPELLDAFGQFLVSGDAAFKYQARDDSPSCSSYLQSDRFETYFHSLFAIDAFRSELISQSSFSR